MLRRELPLWTWTAKRAAGIGWYYVGELAFARVELRAFSQLIGPSDDDLETAWRVTEGSHSEPFETFFVREASP